MAWHLLSCLYQWPSWHFFYAYRWLSAILLKHWRYCSLAPSHRCVNYKTSVTSWVSRDVMIVNITVTMYGIMYLLEWRPVYTLTKGLFWFIFPELHSNEGNKHKITLHEHINSWSQEYIHYFIAYMTQQIHKWRLKWRSSHIMPVSRSVYICWCHNQLLMTSNWPDNCDASTWKVTSNFC